MNIYIYIYIDYDAIMYTTFALSLSIYIHTQI